MKQVDESTNTKITEIDKQVQVINSNLGLATG